MYHKGLIIPGIMIFLLIFTYPLWSQLGSAAPKPKLEYPKGEKACVYDKEYMVTSHMKVLNDWRDWVVREGNRVFINDQGKAFEMSLSNECMRCHNNKAKFCDRCHAYAGVNPYCWTCHLEPPAPEEK